MHSNMEPGRGRDTTCARKIPSPTNASPDQELANTFRRPNDTADDSGYAEKGGNDERRLSPEREAQILRRIENGSYNSPSMVDELARRIIRSADL